MVSGDVHGFLLLGDDVAAVGRSDYFIIELVDVVVANRCDVVVYAMDGEDSIGVDPRETSYFL